MNNETEIEWRPVVGYEGIYEISNLGVCRKAKTKRILRRYYIKNKFSYDLAKNGEREKVYVDILVAQAFVPNPNSYTGVKAKNNRHTITVPENFYWVEDKDDLDTVHLVE